MERSIEDIKRERIREARRRGGLAKRGKKQQHTLDAIEMRKRLIARVAEKLDPLIDAHLDLALGYYEAVTIKDEKGKEIVVNAYKKPPDATALRYLKDQVIGKPTETLKVTEDITLKIDI